MNDILFKKDDPEAFARHWDTFVANMEASPRYLRSFVEYMGEISRSRGYLLDDLSFVYMLEGKPVACAFVPLERHEGVSQFSYDGDYIPAPLFLSDKEGIRVFEEIDALAARHQAAKAKFYLDPLHCERYPHNYLQQYDYLDTSILTHLVDLSPGEELLPRFRKNHRQRIRKTLAEKGSELFAMDASNADYKVHEEYRALHFKAAGRATRTKESFDSQFERLKRGSAVLVGLKRGGRAVAYAYFEMHGGKAIYASAADDPDIDGAALGTYHAPNFYALQYLAQHGVRLVDFSQPSTPSAQRDCYPDKKQLAIAAFKWGFPGGFVPQYRGIRYFNAGELTREAQEFKERYAAYV